MEQTENKMGVMPVNKLLVSMSLPMMISMLVQALYNIVDSYFVAKISENALSAVSLAFPIQTLMIAILGEYVGRIYEESKKRPLYIITASGIINVGLNLLFVLCFNDIFYCCKSQ